MRIYVKVRQDWLTSAEHRLRASANTVLVSSIPKKWLSEEALRGLFDVFPGGIKNIWLTRDFTALLDKIKKRKEIHHQLEAAESDLIRECKKRQLKKREKDEKKQRRELRSHKPTKAELIERRKREDEEAKRRAEAEKGLALGENDEPVADGTETDMIHPHEHDEHGHSQQNPFNAAGLEKVGRVFKGAGQNLVGGLSTVGHGLDNELERSGGFHLVQGTRPSMTPNDRWAAAAADGDKPKPSFGSERSQGPSVYDASKSSDQQDLQPHMNTTRKIDNIDEMFVKERTKWYQFWKPPTGGYASPVPQGVEHNPFDDQKSLWATIKGHIPFMGNDEEPVLYPPYVNSGQHEVYQERPEPEWEKWVKAKDRPHHRLPLVDFTPSWLPGLPFIQ